MDSIEAAALALYEHDVNRRWQPDWRALPEIDRQNYLSKARVALWAGDQYGS